ncbi:MAG: hypothetical protein PHV32_11475 [Eubacteriales bacterium]|nr:hypothetical protein [Eubacteriales bacterium]
MQMDLHYRIPIESLLDCAINEYLESDVSQIDKIRKVSLLNKMLNERKIKNLYKRLINDIDPYRSKIWEITNFVSGIDLSSAEMREVKRIVTDFLLKADQRKVLFDRPFIKFFIEQGYLRAAEEFITRAKKEEPQLKAEEIFQAIRNVWIMNSLQIFWGLPVEITPSVYAYSILYPYTDNFLDNPEVDNEEKTNFNNRLSRVLNGENLTSTSFIEEKVFSLVSQIESQYSRNSYSAVFDSLALIQKAQTESVRQDMPEILSFEKVLPLSFFKGGSSVLADAYLVKGNLNQKEMQFAFAYGAFLQLLDDFQDTESDKNGNHQTIFSISNDKEMIANEVRRLISYIFKVNTADESDTPIMSLMKEVISCCTLKMVMDAAGRNSDLIPQKLYKELETRSSIRLPFYKEFEEIYRLALQM